MLEKSSNQRVTLRRALGMVVSVLLVSQIIVFSKEGSRFTINNVTTHVRRYSWIFNSINSKPTNFEQPFNFEPWIDSHPYFSTFKIPSPPMHARKRVSVLIIVSTAPRRFDRRKAIRETWWRECKRTNGVLPECIFITDLQQPSSKYYQNISSENKWYGDMRFQNLAGGAEFGTRYLYHAIYALKNYHFDYLLRMDDDYFFCINKFLIELPRSMLPSFHWGWVHCIESITRPEESMLLFSRDLILTFLKQSPKILKCHPLADQMIGAWTKDLNLTGIFRHDDRIHHTPIVSEEPSLRQKQNICTNYMAIHGCYPLDMLNFWKNRGPVTNNNGSLVSNSVVCQDKNKFDWKLFGPVWRYEPKPCILNPKWNTSKLSTSGGSYIGRQNQ